MKLNFKCVPPFCQGFVDVQPSDTFQVLTELILDQIPQKGLNVRCISNDKTQMKGTPSDTIESLGLVENSTLTVFLRPMRPYQMQMNNGP